MKAEAHMWMEAPTPETVIPVQCDQWKWKLLKKAANLDIAYCFEHNIIPKRCILRGREPNILVSMRQPAELEQTDHSFYATLV